MNSPKLRQFHKAIYKQPNKSKRFYIYIKKISSDVNEQSNTVRWD